MTAAEKLLAEGQEILRMADGLRAVGLLAHAVQYALLAAERIQLAKLLDPEIASR